MNILHITPSYKPAYIYGGPIISVSRLAESQQQVGAEVTVLTTTANGAAELEVPRNKVQLVDNIKVCYFPRWTKDHSHFSPGFLWHLFKTVKSYDVVHIHSWWNLVAMFAVLTCWLRSVRPVLSPRGMLSVYTFEKDNSPLKKWLHRLLGKWLLSKTVLHGTAPAEVAEAQRIHRDWPHFVLPNIIDLPKVDIFFSSGPMKGPLRVVFLSRIDQKKGLDITLNALAKLDIPWHLSIAGEASESYKSELETLINSLDIAANITWLGWLNGDDKYQALKEGDLFVLTSHNENFANVVLESLACGTPVLVSEHIGLSDYVAQNPTLGQVCTLNPIEIASKIEDFFHNHQQNDFHRKAIQQKVLTDFDSQKIATTYIKAYQSLKEKFKSSNIINL